MRFRKLGWVAVILVLAGCAHPAKISTNLSFASMQPGLTVVTLKIKNDENRATTPLSINVSMQFQQGGKWGEPVPVLHPAAFVLNRQEQQIIRATVKMTGESVKAKLTVKEQENGQTLVSSEVGPLTPATK